MNRRPELDVLRAIAVTLVMLLHAEAFAFTTRMGWAGVDLFFVLSGFLVSGLLFTEYKRDGQIRLGRFLVRRGLKIYPSFYFVLLVHIFYYAWKEIPVQTGQILAEIFFYQNYRPGFLGISWSLAIEEHFYFLVVFAAWLALTGKWLRSVPGVIMICISVFLLSLGFRIYTYYTYGLISVFVNDFPTHLRIDALAFGLMLACIYHFRNALFIAFFRKWWKLLFPSAIAAILPVCLYDRSTFIVNTIGYSLLYVGFGIIVSLTIVFGTEVQEGFKKFRLSKLFSALAFIGRYSYTIYLCHFLAGTGVVSLTKKDLSANLPHVVYIIIYLFSCVLCGVILSIVIEKPFLAIREKYFPVKNKTASKV